MTTRAATLFEQGKDEEEGGGAADPTVVAAALGEKRILLTLDKGAANVQRYPERGTA